MAQADQTVQNATFPTVRADINDNLAALFSANSGNTAPTVTVAFQDWIDTSGTDPIWKKRNAANNAWITLGTIDGNDIAFEGTLPDQSGNSGEFLTTNGTDASWAAIFSLTAGASVSSISVANIDFTSIPSYVKRVTVMLNGVSTNGTSLIQAQIGAGSFTTSGYVGAATSTTGTPVVGTSTTGFPVMGQGSAGASINAQLVLTNISGNIWIAAVSGLALSNTPICGGGTVTISGTLDRVRITTVNGTDTFDAGSINILYEG